MKLTYGIFIRGFNVIVGFVFAEQFFTIIIMFCVQDFTETAVWSS